MKRKAIMTSGLLALAFVSAAAFAGQPEDPKAKNPEQPVTSAPRSVDTMNTSASANTTLAKGKFDMLDSNHDGYIDKQEAAASNALTAQFKNFDGNKDNKLSLTEFAAIHDLASIKIDKKGYQ
jgi:Ca2+-binding EF-hand superfamily protein